MPRLHDLLIVLLVGLRPLVWDGDPASMANLVYLAVVQGAAMAALVDISRGMAFRWSPMATVTTALILSLLPACWFAPVPPEGRAYGVQLVTTGVLGWYLLQVLPGRGSLIQASLLGGLAVEGVLALGQKVFVLPAMALSNHQGELAQNMADIPTADLGERIANGGIFGTFTLSNLLAAWLLLAVPVALGAVRSGGPTGARMVALVTALGGGLAFAMTASKGAWLIAAGVLGLAWAWHRRAWWILAAGPLAVLGLFQMPSVAAALEASATVRWEYWQGAWGLVTTAPWTGHGWGAFGQASAAFMPVTAEPTRIVHQGLLEVAVSAGIPIALLWAAGVVFLVWPRKSLGAPAAGSGTVSGGLVVAISVFAVLYGSLLGGLDGNLGWWPGGGGLAVVPWGALLGLILGLVVVGTRALPVAPRSWLVLAMVAFLLHSQIDMDFLSFACLGTLAVLAVLAGDGGRPIPGRGPVVVTALVLPLVGLATLGWGVLAVGQRQAAEDASLLRIAAQGGEEGTQVLEMLAQRPVPPAGRSAAFMEVLTRTRQAAADDHPLVLRLALFTPPGAERLAILDGLRPHLPWHAGLRFNRAEDLMVLGRWEDAVAEARSGIERAPAHLDLHRRFASLLERAARAQPERAPVWWAERKAVLDDIARLTAVVHPKNR